jgi:hypothetical protein
MGCIAAGMQAASWREQQQRSTFRTWHSLRGGTHSRHVLPGLAHAINADLRVADACSITRLQGHLLPTTLAVSTLGGVLETRSVAQVAPVLARAASCLARVTRDCIPHGGAITGTLEVRTRIACASTRRTHQRVLEPCAIADA